MNVVLLGVLTTAGVVALSIIAVIPAFIYRAAPDPVPQLMLSFSVADSDDVTWCKELATVLGKHDVKSTVFIAGKVAESDSDCVSLLSSNEKLDIGSRTFNFRDLTSIPDYHDALQEVQQGKAAVDLAGKLDSRSFKAPYGSTDNNIFSYLSRSGIHADFSYDDHYNVYQDGVFVRFESTTYQGVEYGAGFFYNLDSRNGPAIIEFDSSTDIDTIDYFITELLAGKEAGHGITFVNASELFGQNLTIRAKTGGGFN